MSPKNTIVETENTNPSELVTKAPVAFPTTGLAKKPVYSMVIASQNASAAIRARRFSENLMQELGESVPWTSDHWHFDMLELLDVRRAAIQAAALADVVILALDGHVELPDDVKAWIEEWGGRIFGDGPILIALFNATDSRQKSMTSTRAFLGTIAETCGLTLLHTLGESVVIYQPES